MPDELPSQSPEILREIQNAERKVEGMIRAAEQEAAAIVDKARTQAEALLAERQRLLEQKKKDALAQRIAEAEREAEALLKDAQAQASNLKARCRIRMAEAVELVLKRILPLDHDPLPVVRHPTGNG